MTVRSRLPASRTPRVVCGALGLALLCAVPAPLAAQAPERTPPEEAVARYEAAYAHYQAGRYRLALEELEAARAYDPESLTLVYNLARVYELVGDLESAIAMLALYLERLPAGERRERERTARAIARLRGAVDVRDAEARPAPPRPTPPRPPAPEPRRERGVADLAFWSTGLGGLALVATGSVLGVLALDREASAERWVLGLDGSAAQRAQREDEATRLALAADLTLAAGGGALLAAVLLYALRERTVERPAVLVWGELRRDGLALLAGGAW